MYYGGAGWMSWLGMGLGMVVFWGAVIFLVVWAVRSFNRPVEPKSPAALSILQERLARGEITPEEFAHSRQIIQSPG
jgi:putative membrane protein